MTQLRIRTKRGTVEPFRPNWAQQRLLQTVERQRAQRRPIRIIVLKARQLGISTAIEGILFWESFIHDYHYSLVMAHSSDSTEHLFNMPRLYWDYFPYKPLFTPKYLSKREISWNETGSSLRVATARSRAQIGRGRTINALHASEVAFWETPAETMLGLRQTIPEIADSMIFLESTANGVGNWFHTQWMDAVVGDNDYAPLFFPWYEHPEYTASGSGLTVPMSMLTLEERRLQDTFGLTEDRLAWRRWAIANLCGGKEDQFRQEYPSTPEEAFLTSGSNVFDLLKLHDAYTAAQPRRGLLAPDSNGVMRFEENPTGALLLYLEPSSNLDWGQYFVAGDPAHAGGEDFACAQVINRRTFEQVAVWHGKIDPITFGDELVKLGKFYHDAMISTEVTGPGYATVSRIMSLNYPFIWRQRKAERLPNKQGRIQELYGWPTNEKNKQWAIAELNRLVLDGSLLVHDRRTYEEMRAYVNLERGGFGPASADGHDDCVMALAICCVCARTEATSLGPFDGNQRDASQPLAPPWETWGRPPTVGMRDNPAPMDLAPMYSAPADPADP